MFQNNAPNLNCDEDYIRKFQLKPLSVSVQKLSTKTNKCKQLLGRAQNEVEHCNCGCGIIDEEYYKKLYNIRECCVLIPKLPAAASKTNRKRLATVSKYHYVYNDAKNAKKFKCRDFSIVLAGSGVLKERKIDDFNYLEHRYQSFSIKSFSIDLSMVFVKKEISESIRYKSEIFDENYYKSLHNIKECKVVLPKVPNNKVRKYEQKTVQKIRKRNLLKIRFPRFGNNVAKKITSCEPTILRSLSIKLTRLPCHMDGISSKIGY